MKTRDQRMEKKVLAMLLQYDGVLEHLESLRKEDFTDKHPQMLFDIIKGYADKYHTTLSIDTFEDILENTLKYDDQIEVRVLFDDLSHMKVSADDIQFIIDSLKMYARIREVRKIFLSGAIAMEKEHIDDVAQSTVVALQGVLTGLNSTEIERGFIWERVKDRWEAYEAKEKGESAVEGVSTGYVEMDAVIGGLQPSTVVLFFGKTGGGKSRMLINLAYNVSRQEHGVLYISREMGRFLLEQCIDSRNALLDFSDISRGELIKADKQVYKKSLKELQERKDQFCIVDISSGGTTNNVFSEIERYQVQNGHVPEVVCVDYLNLLMPVGNYSNTSERLGLIAQELHDIARYFKTCIITATQENRAASHALQKGLEHVYGSHLIIPHVEVAILLETEEEPESGCDILWCHTKKNRYGALESFALRAIWEKNYIGNWGVEIKQRGAVAA